MVLYPPDYGSKEMVDDIWNDNADIFGSLIFKTNGNIVGLVIVKISVGFDSFFGLNTDFVTVS